MKAYLRFIALVLVGVVIAPVLGACDGSNPAANETTTEQTAATAQTTIATIAANPFGFDPNHPEGWSAYDDPQAWEDWMRGQGLLIAESDYTFGSFTLLMPLEDAREQFPSAPLSETDDDDGSLITKTIVFDSLVLFFVSEKADNHLTLYSIEAASPDYVTPRGLRVGDDAEKVYALYGVPLMVDENKWSYGDGFYSLFHVVVENGIVRTIHLNSVM